MKKLILFVFVTILLPSCGVKPSDIEPPDEVKNKEFPRTYPNIATDPPPYVVPNR
jgi:hypothetical protein